MKLMKFKGKSPAPGTDQPPASDWLRGYSLEKDTQVLSDSRFSQHELCTLAVMKANNASGCICRSSGTAQVVSNSPLQSSHEITSRILCLVLVSQNMKDISDEEQI